MRVDFFTLFEHPIQRRDFIAKQLQCAAAVGFYSGSRLLACSNPQEIQNSETPISLGTKLWYWIEASQGSGVGSICCYAQIPQTKNAYVEQVVLADSGKTQIAARYFGPEDRNSLKFLPYISFSQQKLLDDEFSISFLKREKNTRKIFRFSFDPKKAKRSGFNEVNVPFKLRTQSVKTKEFQIGSEYYIPSKAFSSKKCKSLATCLNDRSLIPTLLSNKGTNFAWRIDWIAEHTEKKPWLGNIFLTDPVGRLLSYTNVKQRRTQSVKLTPFKDVSLLSDRQDQPINLSDCPYVYLIWEDLDLGLRKLNIQLI